MSTTASSRSRRVKTGDGQDGVVLILAVFAVALLSLLAVGISTAVRVELLASRTGLDRVQSLFLAEAGLNQARAILLYDDPRFDTLLDDWGPDAEAPLDLPQQLGTGYYRVRVHDTCGRININEADYETLVRLTNDSQVAAAIIDWRDRGSTPAPGGAEQEYYAALPHPYSPRNGPFQSVGELLLVRGVTPEMFFGTEETAGLTDMVTVCSFSSNLDPSGQPKLSLDSFRNWGEQAYRNMVMARLGSVLSMYEVQEIWRGLRDLLQAGRPGYTSLAQLVTVAGLHHSKVAQIIDLVCVESGPVSRGKINLNTAPLWVLATLPGSSDDLADAICERRDTAAFLSLGDAADFILQQPNGRDLFVQMIDRVTTQSSSFILESMGRTESNRSFRNLRVLVRRFPDMVVIIRQSEQDWPLPPIEETKA